MNEVYPFQEGVILNVNKPSGMTSFHVVRMIREWIHCKKVGHAGTLDPLATGVLLVCTGKATKQVSRLMQFEKTYRAVVRLGIRTETDDKEGTVIEERPVKAFTKRDILNVLKCFEGEIMQIPPRYAAIKKNGKPLYRWAREGVEVKRDPRRVTIRKIELIGWKKPDIDICVHCSGGTYIRALARDIGEMLGTGGMILELCRTAIGSYDIESALTPWEWKERFTGHENLSIA
ncbi:MAG TPA: tRNA pseudouridine(55) synthase TruB [bacterium]|nr:tRNA pseudouridine(55) synthase TruB [bacterium]